MNANNDASDKSSDTKLIGEKAETFKQRAEAASSAMNVVYKLAAGMGALTTFGYLLLIQFFPSGLTPGEVVFFVFIALAFAFTYAVFIAYGAFISIWIAHLLSAVFKSLQFSRGQLIRELFADSLEDVRSAGSKEHRFFTRFVQGWRSARFAATRAAIENRSLVPSYARGWFLAGTSLFVFAFLASAAFEIHSTQFNEFFLACVFAGLMVIMSLEPPSLAKPSRQATLGRMTFIGIVPLVFVCITAGPAALLNIVFQGLGIRAQDVSIELPESEIGSIERVQELVRRPLLDCRRPQPNKILVHGADILWTGVGEQTLVQFGPGKTPDRSLFSPRQSLVPVGTVKFDTKSIQIIKTVPRIDPCFDLSSDLLFDSGKFELAPQATARIKELSDSIGRFGKPKQIIVRGHSDPRRILVAGDGSKTDNQQLSERRAAAIASTLRQLLHDSKIDIRSEGAGSREPRLKCQQDANTTNYELDQCNKPNRRVEVRVAYAH